MQPQWLALPWRLGFLDAMSGKESADFARRLEKRGYRMLWIPRRSAGAICSTPRTFWRTRTRSALRRASQRLGPRRDDDGGTGKTSPKLRAAVSDWHWGQRRTSRRGRAKAMI